MKLAGAIGLIGVLLGATVASADYSPHMEPGHLAVRHAAWAAGDACRGAWPAGAPPSVLMQISGWLCQHSRLHHSQPTRPRAFRLDGSERAVVRALRPPSAAGRALQRDRAGRRRTALDGELEARFPPASAPVSHFLVGGRY